MKQKNFLKIVTLFLFTIFTINSNAQSTIYSEDFTGQDGKGVIGSTSGVTFDLSGVDWTIDISSATLSANTDWFKVTNEIFEARDIDGNAIWQSKSINISGFSNVSFSLSAVEAGGMESSDIFNTEYRIDGGTWTTAGTNGNLNDDFTSATVSQTGLSGSTLEIRVTMNNGAGTEYHRLDDILVQGTASSDPIVGFDAATSSETETDASFNVSIPVTVSNYGTDQIDVSVAVSGSAEVADYTLNTASLSFTSDGSQNILLDINPDIDDYDDETITLTLTETSSVSGLVISQSTHTLTLADDESAPSIGFDTATSSETETDATFNVLIPVKVSNYSGNQIDVSVASSGTAEGGDFTLNTASLSFTADGSQNISLDINDDADTDAETIIFTITETSAVSGLVISQSTHTVTITDDEIPPVPVAGTVFITEVLDGPSTNFDYLELFNNSNETVSLSTSKLVRYTSAGSYDNFVFDFGADESGSGSDITIPPYGFLIVARSGIRADFNTAFSITLPAGVNYNNGSGNNYFGASRRWKLRTGGTANTDDGTLIDDTLIGVGADTSYKNIFTGVFTNDVLINGTPGALEYLVYNGGAWVNTTAMDGTTAAKDAYIYDDYTVSANAAANNIGVNPGKTLTVNSSIGLDVDGNLTVNGNMSINSGGSLIVSGTSTGNVTYNRTLDFVSGNANGWHLISSPLAAQTYNNDYAETNGLATSGTKRGLAFYNDALASGSKYTYLLSDDSNTSSFNTGVYSGSGIGYSAKRASTTGTVAFTGTINTDDVNGVAVSTSGDGFNLLGVPYTSYISSQTFLTDNSNLEQTQIWVWEQGVTGGNFIAMTAIADNFILAPGQGFFVKAASGTTVNFAETNQTANADTFLKSSRTEVKLLINDGESNRFAKVYFLNNVTKGFDSGYEGETFGGIKNSLDLFSQLVEGNQGKKYQVQSLPKSDLESMVIPIGVIADAGKEITFTADAVNLSSGLKVFLEDTQTNIFTRLDEVNSEYKITLTETLNGVGRFYMHTTASVLSTEDIILNSVRIFKTDSSTLKITGLPKGKTSFYLYNILGKEMMTTIFTANGNKEISLSKLASGIYLAKIQTEKGAISKKIILE